MDKKEELVTHEILAEVRRLRLRTRRNLTAELLGDYRTAFRGSGLTFTDLREYQPGDDVKHIHWKASARTGRVYVKSYEEERRLRVIIALDTSASLSFNVGKSRFNTAREFCAIIALIAQQSHDALGLALCGETLHLFRPPKQSRASASVILSLLTEQRNAAGGTDLAACLDKLNQRCGPPSVIFLVSDFVSPPFEEQLRRLAHRHEVICVTPSTPSLDALSGCGIMVVKDLESGQTRLIDSASRRVKKKIALAEQNYQASLIELTRRAKCELLTLSESPLDDLRQFLKRRPTIRANRSAMN